MPAGWTTGDADRGSNSFIAIGRLKRGVTFDAARSDMDTLGRALAQAYPSDNAGGTVRLVPMNEFGLQRIRPTLVAMLGVVGFVTSSRSPWRLDPALSANAEAHPKNVGHIEAAVLGSIEHGEFDQVVDECFSTALAERVVRESARRELGASGL